MDACSCCSPFGQPGIPAGSSGPGFEFGLGLGLGLGMGMASQRLGPAGGYPGGMPGYPGGMQGYPQGMQSGAMPGYGPMGPMGIPGMMDPSAMGMMDPMAQMNMLNTMQMQIMQMLTMILMKLMMGQMGGQASGLSPFGEASPYGGSTGGDMSAPNSSGGASGSSSGGSSGADIPTGPAAPGVDAMLKHAGSMVGLEENRDRAKIQQITGESGINPSTTPWCAAFAINMLKDHGVLDTKGLSNPNYCPTIKSWSQGKNIYGQRGHYVPKPGDAILFDWQRDGRDDHIGIVERVEGGKVYTIEGNSSNRVKRNCYDLNSLSIDGYVISGKR